MRVLLSELAAMSPEERSATVAKLAHPAEAARPRRIVPRSALALLINTVQAWIPAGRAAR
jgi:hypothetical protein